jgi:hypothetical protein
MKYVNLWRTFRRKTAWCRVSPYLIFGFTAILWGWYLTPQVHAAPIDKLIPIASIVSIASTNFLSPIAALLAPVLNLIP